MKKRRIWDRGGKEGGKEGRREREREREGRKKNRRVRVSAGERKGGEGGMRIGVIV
jgi:hypothetical protein